MASLDFVVIFKPRKILYDWKLNPPLFKRFNW